MSSNAIRAVAIVLGLLAIILAVVGWRMSRSFAENASRTQAAAQPSAQQAVPQILVVIATQSLPANTPITKDQIVLAPVTVAPDEYFANVDDVIGRKPLLDLDAGQPVTPRYFKDTNIIARGIPPGFRALSLKVDDVVGVGGFVRPGDTVDVLVYIKSTTDTPTGEKSRTEDIATQARVLLGNVLVLSYEDHLVEPPKKLENKDANQQAQRRERTAVVAIPEAMVTRVLLGASLGDVRLALHGAQSAELPVVATDASISALPLSDEAKARAASEKVPDEAVTAADFARVTPPPAVKRKLQRAAPPRVEIYRGSKLETVSQ